MPFHSWLPAAMVAPTPVSALLHAVAVVKVGVFSIVRVLTGVFGTDLLSSLNLGLVHLSSLHPLRLLLAHSLPFPRTTSNGSWPFPPSRNSPILSWGGAALPKGDDRRHAPYCHARLWEDHPVFLRRGDLCGHGQKEHQRDGRDRQKDARDHGGLFYRLPEYYRSAPLRRFFEQMVSCPGIPARPTRWPSCLCCSSVPC